MSTEALLIFSVLGEPTSGRVILFFCRYDSKRMCDKEIGVFPIKSSRTVSLNKNIMESHVR